MKVSTQILSRSSALTAPGPQGLALPPNTIAFVTELSKDFAIAAPNVSVEFLISFFEGFEASPPRQRAACLQYMVPWLTNLGSFMHTSREQQAESMKRIREILGQLIKITVQQPEVRIGLKMLRWPTRLLIVAWGSFMRPCNGMCGLT